MNKKTFALACIFFCATIAWLGFTLYWKFYAGHPVSGFDLIVALLCVLARGAMVIHEFHEKKRRHLHEVNRNQIP